MIFTAQRRRNLLSKAHLSLGLVEHIKCRLLQVLLLRLGRVIDVDGVGGALRQVAVIDGASFCLELKTTASLDGPSIQSKPRVTYKHNV